MTKLCGENSPFAHEDWAINKDDAFDDCVILSQDSFDPDAVFMDDIVDDDVLPRLSLAVEGLTSAAEGRKGRFELSDADLAANEEIPPDVGIATTTLGPDQLDVYGWEFSIWKKIKGYFGR